MQIHASSAARDGAAVLVTGPAGSGKSDLVLRLFDFGFTLVADDQVMVNDGVARAPDRLRGLLEIRGLGITRVDHVAFAKLWLVVDLIPGGGGLRLPEQRRDAAFGLPLIEIDPWHASAAKRVSMALDCVTGALWQLAGAFAA